MGIGIKKQIMKNKVVWIKREKKHKFLGENLKHAHHLQCTTSKPC